MSSKADDEIIAMLERGRPAYFRRGRNEVNDLALRLSETAEWCARHTDRRAIRTSLWTVGIAPQALARDRWAAVDDVIDRRRQDLGAVRFPRLPPGRALVYFPDANLSDGAAEAESGGFFDVYNAPAWGTWV